VTIAGDVVGQIHHERGLALLRPSRQDAVNVIHQAAGQPVQHSKSGLNARLDFAAVNLAVVIQGASHEGRGAFGCLACGLVTDG